MATTYTKLRYHILFGTRNAHPLIRPEIQDPLYRYIGGIIRRQRGSLLDIGGQADHVHLLLGIRKDLAVADMVRLIKANSSKWTNTPETPFAWQRGYAGFTVSESQVPRVRQYIRDQEMHHRKLSYADEFRRLLELHELKMDETAPEPRQHTYSRLRYHIVFATKQRFSLIAPEMQAELYRTAGGIVEHERGTLLEIGGMPDHVHLLLDIPPGLCVSEMLRSVKANTSAWMNDHGDPGAPFGWQRGFGAFSVSESQIPVVRDYVQRQEEHHRAVSFAEEFHRLLARHGLAITDTE